LGGENGNQKTSGLHSEVKAEKRQNAKVLNFYLQALSAKIWPPKGRRSKETHVHLVPS